MDVAARRRGVSVETTDVCRFAGVGLLLFLGDGDGFAVLLRLFTGGDDGISLASIKRQNWRSVKVGTPREDASLSLLLVPMSLLC
ncbi:MAG: hypothetical protein WC763_05560 [Candidatus Paceibacterota bacterium]